MSSMPTPEPTLSPDKALAIGAYGETVAAYRYLVLSEKALTPAQREEFAAMADEEQDHKQRLQRLLADNFPNADFFLRPEDKEMVVVGPRLLKVRDAESFAQAMHWILGTERRTAQFYAKLSKLISQEDMRALFDELATEGIDHYRRLRELAKATGIEPEDE